MLKFEKTLPVGVQVYSVRDYASKDLEGTMMKLKEIGYDYVEPAGLYGKTAEEYKAVLDKCGITAICAHVPYAEMIADLDKVISDYKTLGVSYIAVPYLGEDDRPGAKNFDTVLENIRSIGKKCAENGLTLLYHNHDFEFVKMPDGRYGLDYMYETVEPEYLQTELDCCWVNVGGENPASYVRKYENSTLSVTEEDGKLKVEIITSNDTPSAILDTPLTVSIDSDRDITVYENNGTKKCLKPNNDGKIYVDVVNSIVIEPIA